MKSGTRTANLVAAYPETNPVSVCLFRLLMRTTSLSNSLSGLLKFNRAFSALVPVITAVRHAAAFIKH